MNKIGIFPEKTIRDALSRLSLFRIDKYKEPMVPAARGRERSTLYE